MSKKTDRELERQESIDQLRKWLPPGSTVHCVLRHVSRSGMQRRISFLKLEGSEYLYLDYHVGRVLGLKRPEHYGLVVGGWGMDMGFHVVNSLSYAIHGLACDHPACPNCNGTGKGPLVDDYRCHGTGYRHSGSADDLPMATFECGYCDDGKVPSRCERCTGYGRLDENGKPFHAGYTLTHRWI